MDSKAKRGSQGQVILSAQKLLVIQLFLLYVEMYQTHKHIAHWFLQT